MKGESTNLKQVIRNPMNPNNPKCEINLHSMKKLSRQSGTFLHICSIRCSLDFENKNLFSTILSR